MATITEKKAIIELYVAWFNRVPDSAGLQFWIDQFDAGSSIQTISNEFYSAAIHQFSSETGYSTGMSDSDFITQLYDGVMGRTGTLAPDATEIGYWTGKLNGEFGGDKGAMVVQMIAEIKAYDATGNAEIKAVQDKFNNKVVVAQSLALESSWDGTIAEGKALLSTITDDDATVDAILSGGSSSTFNLTNGVDTATANIFNAERVYDPEGDDQMNSLQDDDVLTGTGTNPTLNMTYVNDTQTGDADISPTLNGIETINVAATTSVAVTLDLQDATGVNAINVTRMDAAFTADNMTSAQSTLSVANSNEIGNNLNFLYEDAALSGTADSTTLTMSNAQLGVLTVEEIGAGDQGYETINLVSSGAANRIAGGMAAEDIQTLNITGDQNMRIDGLAEGGSLTTVDASGMTGTAMLDFTVSAGVMGATNETTGADTTFALTATSNNDVVRISDQVGTNDTLALGDGTADTLAMTGTATTNFLADNATAQVTGVELATVTDTSAAAATLTVDMDQMSGDQTTTLTNSSTVAGDLTTFDLDNATAAEATALTINHATLGSNGTGHNLVNLDVADSGVTAASMTIAQGANTSADATFNFGFTVDSDGTNGNTTNTVTSVTLADTDNKSNTVQLNEFAQHTGTITLTGGSAGAFFNLDAAGSSNTAGNGFGFDQTGTTANSHTGVAAANRDNDVAAVFYGERADGVVEERLVATTINASAQLSNVTMRVGDAAQTITTGTGDDTVIFDAVAGGTVATAGLTVADSVTTGTGTDTVVVDGENAAGIALGASEWTGLSGVDVLRLGDNSVGAYTVTATDQLIDQTDAGNRITIINNDGDLATSNESAATVVLTGLAATNFATYIGEDSNTVGADNAVSTVVLDDASANSNFILNGGDDNTAATAVATTAGTASGNNNVLQINNTAIVTSDDLANVQNFATINFTNTEATDQTLTLTLTDAVVDALVDSSNTASATAVETLVINAVDNGVVSDAILNIDGSALTAQSALDITSGNGADTIALGASAADTIRYEDATDGVDTITGFVSGSDKIAVINTLATALDDIADNTVLEFVTTGINDGNVGAAVAASLTATNEMLLLDNANSNLTAANLTNLTNVAAALEAQITLTAAAGDDGLIVVESSDTAGTFGVYTYTENGTTANQFDADELTLLAVVTGDDVVATDFITT